MLWLYKMCLACLPLRCELTLNYLSRVARSELVLLMYTTPLLLCHCCCYCYCYCHSSPIPKKSVSLSQRLLASFEKHCNERSWQYRLPVACIIRYCSTQQCSHCSGNTSSSSSELREAWHVSLRYNSTRTATPARSSCSSSGTLIRRQQKQTMRFCTAYAATACVQCTLLT